MADGDAKSGKEDPSIAAVARTMTEEAASTAKSMQNLLNETSSARSIAKMLEDNPFTKLQIPKLAIPELNIPKMNAAIGDSFSEAMKHVEAEAAKSVAISDSLREAMKAAAEPVKIGDSLREMMAQAERPPAAHYVLADPLAPIRESQERMAAEMAQRRAEERRRRDEQQQAEEEARRIHEAMQRESVQAQREGVEVMKNLVRETRKQGPTTWRATIVGALVGALAGAVLGVLLTYKVTEFQRRQAERAAAARQQPAPPVRPSDGR